MISVTPSTKKNKMEMVLNNDINNSNCKVNWNKLIKSAKFQKLEEYSILYCQKNNISCDNFLKIFNMLKNKLNQGRLTNNKDVIYDTENQIIINIPAIQYNEKNNTFMLKREERRKNTLKSLTPSKKN